MRKRYSQINILRLCTMQQIFNLYQRGIYDFFLSCQANGSLGNSEIFLLVALFSVERYAPYKSPCKRSSIRHYWTSRAQREGENDAVLVLPDHLRCFRSCSIKVMHVNTVADPQGNRHTAFSIGYRKGMDQGQQFQGLEQAATTEVNGPRRARQELTSMIYNLWRKSKRSGQAYTGNREDYVQGIPTGAFFVINQTILELPTKK